MRINICKKCQEKIPSRAVIDGKVKLLKSRSYCLKCSPWGSKNGYDLRKEKTKTQLKNDKCCPICDRKFSYTKNNVCSSCRSLYTRFLHKKKAVEHLGGKCSKCDQKELNVLSFHHIDPSKKTLEMSGAFGTVNWEIIEKELENCIILCLNCHQMEHSNKDRIEKILKYYELKNISS